MTLALGFAALPAQAARPLLDTHKLDGVFALYAPDVMVPWKKATVRLDTYSGAPVEFAAYEADPAEVLVAGSSRIRAIDPSQRRPVARWKYSPPEGYKFESNDVELPLRSREGFFVVEARRGDAAQQTWVNLTRIGLVTKETPEGWILYGADLSNGQPLRGMRVTLLVGTRFVEAKTDANGLLQGIAGARFALAQWGRSHAFVSLSPQAPLPHTIVGIRTDRGVVRAGETVRVIGFARKREGKVMRPLSGEVRVTALESGRQLAAATLSLGPSGGFSGELSIPQDAQAGDLAILASAGGAAGGTSVHLDAAGDYAIAIGTACTGGCSASAPLPLRIAVRQAGSPVAGQTVTVRVVRTPHVIPPGESSDIERWGTTTLENVALRTGADGFAALTLPAPSDGLSSTYGIVAATQSATATTRIVVPNAPTVVAITAESAQIDLGQTALFDVRGFDANDGRPASGRSVNVRLEKGPDVQSETARLDADGRAQVAFHSPQLGTNVATAQLADDANAIDATAVTVAPQALGARTSRSGEIALDLDKERYTLGERVGVSATLGGAVGSALITVEGGRVGDVRVVSAGGGRAAASLSLANAIGAVRVGVALVRDGAIYTAERPIAIDGPGYPRVTSLAADRSAYAPGATAHISIKDGASRESALLAIRVSDGRPSGGASFEDAPALLAAGGTTTQTPAAPDPNWHAYVAPAGSKAQDIFGTERARAVAPRDNSLAVSAPRAIVWRIDRAEGGAFDVALPTERGRYVVSVLKISDDGDVGAASLSVSVQ